MKTEVHVHNHNEEGLDMNDVSLEEITKDTLMTVLKLDVSENQKKYVAPNSVSIAQAHYFKSAWYKAICYEKIPVGFVMLDINEEKSDYYLWRFMLDARYQGFKIGTKALELIVLYIKSNYNATQLSTSFINSEESPEEFFKKFGFIDTESYVDNEKIFILNL